MRDTVLLRVVGLQFGLQTLFTPHVRLPCQSGRTRQEARRPLLTLTSQSKRVWQRVADGKVMESFAGGWFVDTTFFNSRCRVPHKKDKYQGSAAYPVAPFERIAATGIFERAGRFGWKDPSRSLLWSAAMRLE